jgi:hypothetical protein
MKCLLIACFLTATLAAKDPPELRAAKHHMDLVATRAAANFRSADSIEANLRDDGAVLHPQLIALRARIEAALSEARYDIDEHDYSAAEDALTRGGALLDRFAKEIGGY